MDPILVSAAAILLKESYPHLQNLAGEAFSAAVKKIAGEKGKEWAEAAGLLKKKVDDDPVAKALTGVLQAEPGSEDATRVLRDHLGHLIERDPVLKEQLSSRVVAHDDSETTAFADTDRQTCDHAAEDDHGEEKVAP